MRVRAAEPVQLRQETLLAYADYLLEAKPAATALQDGEPFLWTDRLQERKARLLDGDTITQYWSGTEPLKVPDGLIHDWIGATRASGATMEKTLAVLRDYDTHKIIYARDVIDSGVVTRQGDDFQIYLRIRKKKIVTAVLDTYHDVHYSSPDPAHALCTSRTTRIAEVEEAGKPGEWVRLPGTGYGFLWSLSSYWRLEAKDGGVDIECRAISLTRDIPKGLSWIIEPMVDKLPGEALKYTLEATRGALAPGATVPPITSGAS